MIQYSNVVSDLRLSYWLHKLYTDSDDTTCIDTVSESVFTVRSLQEKEEKGLENKDEEGNIRMNKKKEKKKTRMAKGAKLIIMKKEKKEKEEEKMIMKRWKVIKHRKVEGRETAER